MMSAYNESYLDDAMQNLGDMVEYAVCDCGYDPDEFFGWFISSGVASKFEKGNPKFITGMSGFELAEAVLRPPTLPSPVLLPPIRISRGVSIGPAGFLPTTSGRAEDGLRISLRTD